MLFFHILFITYFISTNFLSLIIWEKQSFFLDDYIIKGSQKIQVVFLRKFVEAAEAP